MVISIKEPCHENWLDMTPNQQGAFCGKCVKTVVDFSTKSIDEIKNFFNTANEQKICGRFETSQLTNLSFDDFYSKFSRFHFSKRIALIVCLTFAAWLFGSNNALAQTTNTRKSEVHLQGDVAYVPEPKDTIKKCVTPNNNEHMIMGKVAYPKPIKDTSSTNNEKHMKMGEVKAVPTRTLQPKSVKKK